MSTELVPATLGIDIAKLEAIVREHSLAVSEQAGRIGAGLTVARGYRRLKEALTEEVMADIMAIQGQPIGFLTDKDVQGGYSVDEVRNCLIDAAFHGAYASNNEFNIIAGRAYITKNGFARMLREYPGLTDLKIILDVPVMKSGGAIVRSSARWRINGVPDMLMRVIPVRVNRGMGTDAILGKATRKLFAAVYGQLTGSEHTVPEGEVDEGDSLKPAAQSIEDFTGEPEEPEKTTTPPVQPEAGEARSDTIQSKVDDADHVCTGEPPTDDLYFRECITMYRETDFGDVSEIIKLDAAMAKDENLSPNQKWVLLDGGAAASESQQARGRIGGEG